MFAARYLAPIAAGLLILNAIGCGSGKSAAELKAFEAEHPLGPFEGSEGEFSTTESGLKYRITREGTGDTPSETDIVEVHYQGKLVDGTEFDSSYKRKQSIQFMLQEVIAGWTEGLQLVSKGGQIDLIIPSQLAYGPVGQGDIPPDSTLYFTVELLDFKAAPQPPKEQDAGDSTGTDTRNFESDDPLGPFAGTEGEFATTDSGLKYRIVREGGGTKPKASDAVKVHYEGKFGNGNIFDSSYADDQPITFPLNMVIAGWTEGMQLVGEGGKIELIVPSEIGYGTSGRGPVPPNATLYFTVELLKINP